MTARAGPFTSEQTSSLWISGYSGDLLPSSPPAEKATARQDQAGQPSTGDGAGDRSGDGQSFVVFDHPGRAGALRTNEESSAWTRQPVAIPKRETRNKKRAWHRTPAYLQLLCGAVVHGNYNCLTRLRLRQCVVR